MTVHLKVQPWNVALLFHMTRSGVVALIIVTCISSRSTNTQKNNSGVNTYNPAIRLDASRLAQHRKRARRQRTISTVGDLDTIVVFVSMLFSNF